MCLYCLTEKIVFIDASIAKRDKVNTKSTKDCCFDIISSKRQSFF